MDDNSRSKINRNIERLIEDMDADSLAINLLSNGIFTERHVQDIQVTLTIHQEQTNFGSFLLFFQTLRTKREKSTRLIEIIKTRGETAFDYFVEGLKTTQQTHLAVLVACLYSLSRQNHETESFPTRLDLWALFHKRNVSVNCAYWSLPGQLGVGGRRKVCFHGNDQSARFTLTFYTNIFMK